MAHKEERTIETLLRKKVVSLSQARKASDIEAFVKERGGMPDGNLEAIDQVIQSSTLEMALKVQAASKKKPSGNCT